MGVCLSISGSLIRSSLYIIKNVNIADLHIFKETLCTSSQELEDCVNNVKVDTSSCLKPCSGLIVTSFVKSELKKNLETLFPIFGQYKLYKKVTTYPSLANGIL